jgi:protein tyrosine/serine phosphatase
MKLFLLRALLVLSLYAVPQLFAQSEKNSLPLISAPPFGEKLKISGLPNAGKISDSLYRGAQPHAEGFQELKKIGITAIVDLRKDNPQKLEWERKQAEAVGIRFVNIPVSGWSPPTNEQVSQFLSLFNSGREKVFVHCRFGDDRTGVFVASYRVAHDGWSAERAIKEMYFFGFNGRFHPSMKAYVRDFPAALKTAPAFAPTSQQK